MAMFVRWWFQDGCFIAMFVHWGFQGGCIHRNQRGGGGGGGSIHGVNDPPSRNKGHP